MGRDGTAARPAVGRVGIATSLLLLLIALVLTAWSKPDPYSADPPPAWAVAYALGLTVGWWCMLPRPGGREHYVQLASALPVQVASYVVLGLAVILGHGTGGLPAWLGVVCAPLGYVSLGMLLFFGPFLALVGLFAVRRGLPMLIAQVGVPCALVLFG